MFRWVAFASLVTVLGTVVAPRSADACGCFAAPPAFPVIQAGEKILFARKGRNVVAHIQIQYEGEADEFGWLIPVPSVPDVRAGAEEIFAQLEATTSPGFVYAQLPSSCGGGFGCGSEDFASGVVPNSLPDQPSSVVVLQSSAGPFDFAVVRADSKTPMLDWLVDNGYVVPAGGEDLLDPYIGSGTFFLALKLRSGLSTGDIQPIVIEYEADVPMIPLILTRLGATPDMGVLVWLLGESRAVSVNYRHVQINDEYIDWVNGGRNYAEVVARAVDEAENGHAFVTEYAGSSSVMSNRLAPEGRFGTRETYENTDSAVTYVRQLQADGFPMPTLRPIFERIFPIPETAINDGIQPDEYYDDLGSSLRTYDPEPEGFDPISLTAELWERVVEPMRDAAELFDRNLYLTRLYTAISPEEMTVDPAFAFNPDLPQVDNIRRATMTRQCEPDDVKYPFQMTFDDGRQYNVRSPADWATRATSSPRTTVIERMRLEGAPVIEVDNRAQIAESTDAPESGGCSNPGNNRWTYMLNFAFIFGAVLIYRRRLQR